jgi:sugar-specific transcriptional regulator TrmB
MSDRLADARRTAVEQLQELGLSTYAARTFVTLSATGEATARGVSQASEVPRTKVYDAAAELEALGLVGVREASPKRFYPASTETTSRRLREASRDRTVRLTAALSELEPTDRRRQRDIWTAEGRETVAERVLEFVGAAEREIVYATSGSLLSDEIVDALRSATERGAAVELAADTDAARDRLREAVPTAEVAASPSPLLRSSTGRLLVADGTATLVGVVENAGGAKTPTETAVWASGETNGLAVILRALLR